MAKQKRQQRWRRGTKYEVKGPAGFTRNMRYVDKFTDGDRVFRVFTQVFTKGEARDRRD